MSSEHKSGFYVGTTMRMIANQLNAYADNESGTITVRDLSGYLERINVQVQEMLKLQHRVADPEYFKETKMGSENPREFDISPSLRCIASKLNRYADNEDGYLDVKDLSEYLGKIGEEVKDLQQSSYSEVVMNDLPKQLNSFAEQCACRWITLIFLDKGDRSHKFNESAPDWAKQDPFRTLLLETFKNCRKRLGKNFTQQVVTYHKKFGNREAVQDEEENDHQTEKCC